MKIKILLIVILCFLEFATSDDQVQILKNEYIATDDGYSFQYETSDGQKREEVSYTTDVPDIGLVNIVYGSYSYIGPDGITYSIRYTADHNGYKAYGLHIPGYKPPKKNRIQPNALKSLIG